MMALKCYVCVSSFCSTEHKMQDGDTRIAKGPSVFVFTGDMMIVIAKYICMSWIY
ncbi:hypothetical protein Plhal304r1_c083g0167731 [Plasmopara halstedii]